MDFLKFSAIPFGTEFDKGLVCTRHRPHRSWILVRLFHGTEYDVAVTCEENPCGY